MSPRTLGLVIAAGGACVFVAVGAWSWLGARAPAPRASGEPTASARLPEPETPPTTAPELRPQRLGRPVRAVRATHPESVRTGHADSPVGTLDSVGIELPGDLEQTHRTDRNAIWYGPKKELTDVRGETLRLSNLVIDLSISESTMDEQFDIVAGVFGDTLRITSYGEREHGWIIRGEFVDSGGFDRRFVSVMNTELGVLCQADAFDESEIDRAVAACQSVRAR